MINPFIEKDDSDIEDKQLVAEAVAGNKKSLETLVKRHQAWIYNISLKMVWDPVDAEDVTQETLIKIITKLSTFRQESSLRTWLYRIVANHVINMKKRKREFEYYSFDKYGTDIINSPNTELPDQDSVPVEVDLLIEETKIGCMNAMLLCLDREQRLIFILGNIFGVNDDSGSEILGISKVNFRQKLSRARRQLANFMTGKCGLMDKSNPCHCNKKTKLMMNAGHVDPNNLVFTKSHLRRIEVTAPQKAAELDDLYESKAVKLFRDHRFVNSPDFANSIMDIVASNEFRNIFNLNHGVN
ncbi:MAG: RNA polymerase sigma factor [Ignavibacteria bacterium]|jgi:RNA polymerase sigma factor (sigma-70 family)|nr:RNA polymerase sigma factor [Ignavibacteria bacterium]MBK6875085.1 RNA polymerase sigma factor [Ignavibacteria bacterium]